jgi:hypothetical protein
VRLYSLRMGFLSHGRSHYKKYFGVIEILVTQTRSWLTTISLGLEEFPLRTSLSPHRSMWRSCRNWGMTRHSSKVRCGHTCRDSMQAETSTTSGKNIPTATEEVLKLHDMVHRQIVQSMSRVRGLVEHKVKRTDCPLTSSYSPGLTSQHFVCRKCQRSRRRRGRHRTHARLGWRSKQPPS